MVEEKRWARKKTHNRRAIFAPPFNAGISVGSFMIVCTSEPVSNRSRDD